MRLPDSLRDCSPANDRHQDPDFPNDGGWGRRMATNGYSVEEAGPRRRKTVSSVPSRRKNDAKWPIELQIRRPRFRRSQTKDLLEYPTALPAVRLPPILQARPLP